MPGNATLRIQLLDDTENAYAVKVPLYVIVLILFLLVIAIFIRCEMLRLIINSKFFVPIIVRLESMT